MLCLGANSASGNEPQPRLFLEQGKLCAARRRAIEALVEKGLDMRQNGLRAVKCKGDMYR